MDPSVAQSDDDAQLFRNILLTRLHTRKQQHSRCGPTGEEQAAPRLRGVHCVAPRTLSLPGLADRTRTGAV